MIAPFGLQNERQLLPDQLRGFALLGIVVVNMPFLALTNGGLSEAAINSPADGVVAFLIVALAQGKFYLLFAFLFGYSLTLILRKSTKEGLRRYRRRLLGLAVLGILHAMFFFIGDILLSYAILGVVLLWFTVRATKTAMIASAVTYGVGLVILVFIVLATVDGTDGGGGFVNDPASLNDALKGTFLEAATARIDLLPSALIFLGVVNWMPALAMFLLGLAAGRAGVLARPHEFRRLWKWLVVIAVTVGLPAGIVSAWLAIAFDDPTGFASVLSLAIGFGLAPALTGGYVAAAALATNTKIMSFFAPAGRMSLTGYLGESILLCAIFSGWGLGLFGQLSIAQAALVALLVWLTLDLFASFWLRRFAYGPFEWILRCWSTGARVPLLKLPTSTNAAP